MATSDIWLFAGNATALFSGVATVALVRSRFIRHSKLHCSYANYVASVP